MTVDVLHPRGKSCKDCKHKSDYETSAEILMDFGYKGHYWKCELRSYLDANEVFPRRVTVYTSGSSLCSSWEPKDKKK